ncbi:unnamed protein product [Ectocarpus sp. CCAP 1310/34]|nr:unnamed protein product [Ectocarpus sp. CCAP 1310/34]
MEDLSEEVALASTASPSPMPPPPGRDPSATTPRQCFRAESLATLTAPLDAESTARAARTRCSRLPPNRAYASTTVNSLGHGDNEEEKLPIPDKRQLESWARYGFVDAELLLLAADQPQGGRKAAALSEGLVIVEEEQGGDVGRSLVRNGAAAEEAGDGLRRQNERQQHEEEQEVLGERKENHHPPAARSPTTTHESTPATADGERRRPEGGAERDISLAVGSSTPLTDTMTPSSQERRRDSTTASADAAAGIATAVGTKSSSSQTTAKTSRTPAGGLDSMAASLLASQEAARGKEEEEEEKEEETKEVELAELTQQEEREADVAAAATVAQQEANQGSRAGSSRRAAQTKAEIERHKRNRAERLRAYGCQRSLYPRIVPGRVVEGGLDNYSTPARETEEMETEEWVNTLRVSAAIRGESLMAACSQSFAEHTTNTLLGDKQSEARASRTADVSVMEGPDGLLHCAVLRGDHALAARAAQFLVDKRGSNVNSRDEWGRTPLHTAAGKGMVAMARFFIRRGADVDALDQDDRTPLFFACASGNTTVARYLTRIEVGARYDIKDKRGHLAGEYFWESVEPETRDEIVAILAACGWPHPPPPPRNISRLRGRGLGRGSCGRHGGQRERSPSAPPSRTASPRNDRGGAGGGGHGRAKTHSDGGEAGMKRLASDMMMLMKRR